MKKITRGFILLLTLIAVLAACSAKGEQAADQETNEQETNDEQVTPEEVTTIKVGTMGTYHPFSYEDEDGNLTGYDLEVLRLVEDVDPSLKFEFIAGPWDSLFVGLDSDKFQLIANQITATEERKEKYTLTNNQYFTSVSQLIISGDTDDISSIEDIEGRKIGLTIGDAHTFTVEDWNEANNNILDDAIVFYEQDITPILQDIVSGRIDATVNDPIVAQEKAAVQDLDVKVVGDRLEAVPTYFIAKQDEKGAEIIDRIDAALDILIEEGRLSELSIEYFEEDYSK